MATTPNLGLHYPAASDAPDGPGAIYNLATDVDTLLLARLPRTLVVAQRNGGGTLTRGTFSDIAYDTIVMNPLGVLQANGTDFKLPFDGIYEIETKIAVQADLTAAQALISKWWVPGDGGDGPWVGATGPRSGVPLLYRDTFRGTKNVIIRTATSVDGAGPVPVYTTPQQLPKVVLRYLGQAT